MRREPLAWDGAEFTVPSPEGASTIESVPGATIETAREVARLLERAAANEATPPPPSMSDVFAEMDKIRPE